MNAKTKFAAALMGALVLGACSNGDDVVGINSDCSNLSGVFSASSATVTGTGTGGTTVNLLDNSSALDLTLSTGTFSSSYRVGSGGQPLLVSGTLSSATEQNIVIPQSIFTSGGSGSSFDCSISGNTLTLDAPKSTFTFAGQTDPSPADIRIVLHKTSE